MIIQNMLFCLHGMDKTFFERVSPVIVFLNRQGSCAIFQGNPLHSSTPPKRPGQRLAFFCDFFKESKHSEPCASIV